MAITIPTARRATVVAAGLPGAQQMQVSPDAYGAGLGEGIGRAGQTINRDIISPEWDRANAAKVDGAAANVARARMNLEARLAGAQGEDAIKAAAPLEAEFSKAVDEQRATLANPAQKDAFERHAQAMDLSWRDRVNGHVINESQKAEAINNEALTTSLFQSAVTNRNDPQRAWADQAQAEQSRSAFLARRGIPAEAIKLDVSNMRSRYVATVVVAMANEGNGTGAQGWLDSHRDELTNPDDLARATAIAKVQTTRSEAQRAAALIYNPGKSLEAMAGEADQIANQDVQAETKQRLASLHSLHQQGIQEQQRTAMTDGWTAMNTDPRGLDAITPEQQIAMGPERFGTLQSAERRRVAGTPINPQESLGLRYELERLATQDPQAFLSTDLTKPGADGRSLLTSTTPEDFKALAARQQSLREKGITDPEHMADSEIHRISRQYLGMIGIDNGINPGKDADMFTQVVEFDRQFRAELRSQGKGGPVAPQVAEQIAARLTANIPVPGRVYGTNDVPYFQARAAMKPDDRATFERWNATAPAQRIPFNDFKTIPPANVDQITARFVAEAGREPSQRELLVNYEAIKRAEATERPPAAVPQAADPNAARNRFNPVAYVQEVQQMNQMPTTERLR